MANTPVATMDLSTASIPNSQVGGACPGASFDGSRENEYSISISYTLRGTDQTPKAAVRYRIQVVFPLCKYLLAERELAVSIQFAPPTLM